MNATTFFNEIKTNPRRAYLLHGEEEYAKERALFALKALVNDETGMAVSELEGPGTQALIEACETLPLLCDRRLVIARNARAWASESDAKALAAYLPRIPETTILAVYVRSAADKRKALYKAFDGLGGVAEFETLSDEDAARWAAKTALQRGCMLEPREARLLVALAGRSLLELSNELQKCCDYAGKGQITPETLNACVHRNIEVNIFHMLEAMLSGRVGQGIELLHDMLRAGEEPLRILSFLAGRFRAMLVGKAALEASKPRNDALKAIGGSPYAAGKSLDAAKRFTRAQLESALKRFADADADIKLSRQEPRLALELALLASII